MNAAFLARLASRPLALCVLDGLLAARAAAERRAGARSLFDPWEGAASEETLAEGGNRFVANLHSSFSADRVRVFTLFPADCGAMRSQTGR